MDTAENTGGFFEFERRDNLYWNRGLLGKGDWAVNKT
jgi:hypothetical protein